MKNRLPLVLLIAIVFLSGCITTEKTTVSNVGLSRTLTSDVKQAKPSMPITFILTVKNLASENAEGILAQLLNLTGWTIENELQRLDELMPNDLYKFSWIAYAPSTANKTFMPYANVFYKMETHARLKLRVYDNSYLNSLKPEEREKIKEGSALLSSIISKNTPVAVKVSLQQPFILTEYSQRFPFVLEIKNAGLGKAYSDYAIYSPGGMGESYVRFGYKSNSTVICDFNDGELVQLINGTKSVACRLLTTQDDVNKYADSVVDFTISYSYLDKASAKIEVK
jgi:hypothetical protein